MSPAELHVTDHEPPGFASLFTGVCCWNAPPPLSGTLLAKAVCGWRWDLRKLIRALPEVGANDFESVYQAAVRALSVGRASNITYAGGRQTFFDRQGCRLERRVEVAKRKDGCKCLPNSMIVGFDGYDGGKPKGLVE